MSEELSYQIFRNDAGQVHREDGPAIIWEDGSSAWYINDQKHREDGPAFQWSDGSESWFYYDKRHRLDGPALIRKKGSNLLNEWWILGVQMNDESEFINEVRKQKLKLLD